MKNNLTELVFILDRSGSMEGKEQDVVGGFNSMLKKQKRENEETLVTTIFFSNDYDIIHDRENIKKLKPLSIQDFAPDGWTALFDAIGDTIERIKLIHKHTNAKNKPNRTLFVIATDGMENSSCKYTYSKIKEMIKQQESVGWNFIFVAESIDNAENLRISKMAKDIGIDEDAILIPPVSEYKVSDYYRTTISDTIDKFRSDK